MNAFCWCFYLLIIKILIISTSNIFQFSYTFIQLETSVRWIKYKIEVIYIPILKFIENKWKIYYPIHFVAIFKAKQRVSMLFSIQKWFRNV